MSTSQEPTMIKDWEFEFIKTGDIERVPIEDRERVLHELNELCQLAQILVDISRAG